MLYRYTKGVKQSDGCQCHSGNVMCSVTSPFYWLPRYISQAALAWRLMIVIIFSMHGVTLQLPAPLFLAAQAILTRLHKTSLPDSHHVLAVNWPISSCDFTGDAAFQRHRGLVIGAL